jgi:hypothetical protein
MDEVAGGCGFEVGGKPHSVKLRAVPEFDLPKTMAVVGR